MNQTSAKKFDASMQGGEAFAIAILGAIAALVITYAWGGYVFSMLWAWFIVTAFAAPPIGVAQSIGVLLVVGFAAKPRHLKKDDDGFGKIIYIALAVPLLFLAVGWIVKQWLPT